MTSKYTYQPIERFFELSTWDQDVKGSFGLQPHISDWDEFIKAIEHLQSQTLANERIKVIYLGRHGQATHNLQADEDGLPMYESQKRNPTHDPVLTELGHQQALTTQLALQREIEKGMPLPGQWFVSPLRRAGQTCEIEWSWLFDGKHDVQASTKGGEAVGVPAAIVENIRERLHVLPCNGRSNLTILKAMFPSFSWPEDMAETDTLHLPESVRDQESFQEMCDRAVTAWSEIMDLSESSTYISVTGHGKFTRALLIALGLEERRSALGSLRIIVVKVHKAAK